MVETSSPKPSSKVADNKPNPPYKVKLVKGPKPLIYHKFYLDIEKHHIATKIENKIKELGGSIEFFDILSKEITHFITDKQHTTTTTSVSGQATTSRAFGDSQTNSQQSTTTFSPQTPFSFAESLPTPSPTSNDTKVIKQISRADAILLRARQQQKHQSTPLKTTEESQELKTKSPIEIARDCGRKIWTPEQALKYLEKVCIQLTTSTTESSSSRRLDNVTHLRGDFIKIEIDRQFRPFHSQLKKWPALNLRAPITHGPFESERDVSGNKKTGLKKFSKIDSRTNTTTRTTNTGKLKSKTVGTIMTRKSRPHHGGGGGQQQTTTQTTTTTISTKTQQNKGSSEKQCGYCEICRVEYDVLKVHLKSDEHLSFVKNDDNFASLDRLIESGASVKNLLKFSSKSPVNGLKRHHHNLTNGSGTEEENSDVAENGIGGVVSNGIEDDNVDEDDVEENEGNSHKIIMKRRRVVTGNNKRNGTNSRRETRLTQESHENDNKSITKVVQAARLRGLRWNAPSPESRPPMKEPPVYKVDKNLRETNATTSKRDEAGKQVVVKLKRVRQSELNLLNNEAEQFMFPKTPTYTDTSDTDDDRQTSELQNNKSQNNETIEVISSDKDSARTPKHISPPKKRTPSRRLEQILADKASQQQTAEASSSRNNNRFQESPIQSNNTTPPTVTASPTRWMTPDDRMGENLKNTVSRWANFRKCYQSIETKFNFERVPHNEPWFGTFHRQDVSQEHVYEYFGNATYCKLPYEMGPLPPPRDDCCNLHKLLLNKNGSAATPRKRGGSSAYPRMPSIAKVTDRTRSSTAAIIEATKSIDAADDTTNDSQSTKSKTFLPLKKRKLFLDDMPRKSPREHASTLAILSSMTNPPPPTLTATTTTASLSSASVSRRYRERLNSQLSMDDDENSNSTMTSQQTSRTQVTEKDNSSICSASNNKISINYVNYVKLSREIDEALAEKPDPNEFPDFLEDELDIANPVDFTPICSNIDDLSSIIDLCSSEELTLKSVNNKEREAQRKVTYSITQRLVTSGFRFNKKRRNNRTGWPQRRKPSATIKDPPLKGEEGINEDVKIIKNSLTEDPNKITTITPDMFAVSSDSLDSQTVFMLDKTTPKEYDSTASESRLTDDEEDDEVDDDENDEGESNLNKKKLPTMKKIVTSPKRTPTASKNNSYNKGKYQFEKFPKVNITPIANMKTRSSDLQKRKSITPKKYADESHVTTATSSPKSPKSPRSGGNSKYSPRKLRKPRGCWYRER